MPLGSSLLRHPRFFWMVVAVGMLLSLATLRLGFFADDYAFVAQLDGAVPKHKSTPFDLYDFASGEPSENYEQVRRGPFPWWSDPELKVRFFRPISSALYWLDHAIFGHAPLGYHVHALVWYLALLISVGLVLRCALAAPLWGVAFLLFALTASHAEPVGWVASRHMVIAAAPSIAGLAAYVHWRERGFRAGRWLAVLGLGIGMLGSETAIGAALYWIAYEAVGAPERESPRARLGRIALPAGLVLAYLIAYRAARYGSANNDAYIEPLSHPLRFLRVAAERVPMLFGELFAGVPSSMGTVFSPLPFVAFGLAVTAGIASLAAFVWKDMNAADQRGLSWLTLGAVLSTLGTVGAFPGSRLLLLPGIGGYAIVAAIIVHGWKRVASGQVVGARRFALKACCGFLFVLHGVLSPLIFVGVMGMVAKIAAQTAEIAATLDGFIAPVGRTGAKGPRVFALASDPMAGLYASAAHAMLAPHAVSAWCMLSMARGTHRIQRIDDRTLMISVRPGMLHGSFETVFRSVERPLRPGDVVDLDDVRVTVLSADGAYPTSFEVRFRSASIDDPQVILVAWIDGRFSPLRLARAGDSIEIPWSPGPTGFF